MPTNTDKLDELKDSAQQLAKHALETAELGIRVVRQQFETNIQPGAIPVPPHVQESFQATAFNVESKAKELFTLATQFMHDVNSKWQPAQPAATPSTSDRPKAEKIDIE